MSGIAGLLSPQASDSRERLEKIHRRLAHRGPLQGLLVDGPLALAYCYPSGDSTSPSPSQPLSVHDCWIVADVRLDNREELRRALGGGPGPASDAELIVCAYGHWGTECLGWLEGDFAFALWDSKRQRLFCARDPLGIRPFFYRARGSQLVWASEVKALVADPDYRPAPDEAMLGEYLLTWSHFPDSAATFYRGIRQLPAGHYLTFEAGRLRVQRYWVIQPAEETHTRSFEESVEQFRSLFERAVEQRLGDAEAVAVLVSGGLDSTSISSLAERIVRSNGIPRPVLSHLNYYVFAPRADERYYVRQLEEKYGCPVHYLRVKAFRVLEGLEQSVDLEESPFLDLTWSLTRQWAERLRRHHGPVALTGFGGDNIFPEAGLDCSSHIWRGDGWRAGWQALRRTAAYYGVSPRVLLGPTLRGLLPESLKAATKRWLGREFPPWVRGDFARHSGLLERVRQPLPRQGFSCVSQELDYRHLTSGRLGLQLGYLDRVAAAHGLELRHPLLRPLLVRFTLLAPPEHKFSNGETKRLLRQAMAGILPEAVRHRRDKGHPDAFLSNWIRRHEAGTWLRQAGSTPLAEAYVKPGQALAIVKRFLAGDDYALKPAWNLISLELWLEKNFSVPARN